METSFANNIEIFNEITVLVLSYLIMGFTDSVVDPVTRSYYGLMFIFVCMLNVLVHITFLLMDTISNLVGYMRKMKKKCQKKKKNNALKIGLKEHEKEQKK